MSFDLFVPEHIQGYWIICLDLGIVYMETQTVTMATRRGLKIFWFDAVKSIDRKYVLRAEERL